MQLDHMFEFEVADEYDVNLEDRVLLSRFKTRLIAFLDEKECGTCQTKKISYSCCKKCAYNEIREMIKEFEEK